MLLPSPSSPSKPNPYPALLSVPRLTTLFACLLVAICSGTNYVYSAYAPQLSTRLGINHTQLNIVGLAGNFGVYLTSPIWGRVVDAKGPGPLLIFGFFLLIGGYSGTRLIFDAGLQPGMTTISTFTFCLLVACKLMTGAGGNCGIMSSLNTSAKTFPDRARGLATGIVVSGFGLSAFIFSAIARVGLANDTSSFLNLLAYGTALPMVIGYFFVRPIPLPPTNFDHENGNESGAVNVLERSVGLRGESGSEGEGGEEARLLDQREGSRYGGVSSESLPLRRTESDETVVSPNLYGRALFMNGDFWLFFCILSLLTGTGIMYINNVGSMSQVLYLASTLKNGTVKPYDPAEAMRWQATQVSAISITNFAGRIAIGLTSDLVKRTLSLPRSANLVIVSLLFLFSQIAAASVSQVSNLQYASMMLGFAHGSVFSLGPMVCIEWFGMPHFSENWGYLILSPMLGGNLLSLAFGMNMDRHSTQPSPLTVAVKEGRCELGRFCYVDTLYLTIGVCLLALGLSMWAGYKDWRWNRRV